MLGALENSPKIIMINNDITLLWHWLRWKYRISEIGVKSSDMTILAKDKAKFI